MEDWALIRRLVADGVPQRQVARDLGVGRSTVERALASDRPPKYERPAVPTAFTPFEPAVRQLLAMTPDMPATVIAERVGGAGRSPGSVRTFGVCARSTGRSTPLIG
ncbi:helix-turn-helix domain-containing protein [Branchiibius cervicis]|uniref:Helix-turn-helix domain-containing protein n=1 Tax=Branchiibius cervicis TaxID=908252 RepID=A0ABW2AYQ7_9MICO